MTIILGTFCTLDVFIRSSLVAHARQKRDGPNVLITEALIDNIQDREKVDLQAGAKYELRPVKREIYIQMK